jgi:PAS domain S-box-containing protein
MIFSALINNITLIIALSILYSVIIRRWEYGSRTGQAISGLLFGAVAVIGMINPLIISPGLIFDGRSIIISIAGFIGGWVTALIAALMSMIYRIWLGGPGAIMGVSVIASSAAVGIAYHYIRRRSPHAVGPLHLIGFGIIVHICMLAMTMTLPSGMRFEVLSKIAVPVILIYPLGTLLVCVVLLDLESRIRAEDALRESEALFRSYLENAPDGVYLSDLEGNFLYGNRKCEEIIGYRREELIGKNFLELNLLPENSLGKAVQLLQANREGRSTGPDEFDLIGKEGRLIPVEINTTVVQQRGQRIVLSFVRDITERKRAEEALVSERTLLRNLIDNVPDRIYAKDSEGRFIICNEAMIRRMGKTSMAELTGKSDFELLPPEMAQRFYADEQAVIQTGTPMINREEPLTTEGGTITRWNLATKVPLLDKQGNRIGIVGVGREITDRKQAEQKLKDTLESLRKAVSATIQVVAAAVETRDPYTAGHQMRSADLARAIATEMGLPHEKIDGIRMAGSIHDIGKLSIPAEILSKPTKLTGIEFSLIKEHAQQGYEILKNVESSWPLAEIVYQHHERMDGSGYPRNLKGDEILIEARILTVADVVEAMASHRPYRAGLGIDAALNEIEKNRGTYYDDAAVDACLRLFREKGFKLEGSW